MRTGPETYARKADADRALVMIEAQIRSGEWTDPERGKVKLADYAATWITQRPGLRPRTVDHYRWLLKKHIEPHLGGVPLIKLSTPMIREWRAALLGNGVSVSVAAKAYRFLRAVLMTATEEDMILTRNPCRIKGAGDENAPERPVLTVAQVFALAEQIGRRPVGNVRKLAAGGYRLRFSRDGVMRSLTASLERLGLDRVDIVYLHDPDAHYHEALTTAYPALEELRGQGVVRAIGAGMNQSSMLADFARHTDMDLLMLAGRYTLLEQPALDDLLPVCEGRGIGMVAAGVFNSGLLADPAPRSDAKYNYADAPSRLVQRAQRIAEVCGRYGSSLPAAALALPLAHPAVVSVCVGARSPGQIEGNVALLRTPPPGGLWTELKAAGLLRADVPVPASGREAGEQR